MKLWKKRIKKKVKSKNETHNEMWSKKKPHIKKRSIKKAFDYSHFSFLKKLIEKGFFLEAWKKGLFYKKGS